MAAVQSEEIVVKVQLAYRGAVRPGCPFAVIGMGAWQSQNCGAARPWMCHRLSSRGSNRMMMQCRGRGRGIVDDSVDNGVRNLTFNGHIVRCDRGELPSELRLRYEWQPRCTDAHFVLLNGTSPSERITALGMRARTSNLVDGKR